MDLLLNYSKKIVFLTGAGCSTGSGIPDYRGLGKPICEKSAITMDLTKYLPGPVHKMIAEFVNSGKVEYLLTQNIDDLHRDVLPDKLYELHGNHSKGRCCNCGKVVDWTVYKRCVCGGRLSQSIVDFNTSVNLSDLEEAEQIVDKADLLIIMGTSLKVAPVNSLPSRILKRGGNVIVVNQDPTAIDESARMVYRCDVKDFLEDMGRIWKGGSPTIKPFKMRELPGWDNTINQWTCKFCTMKNKFYPTCCEVCGENK